MTEPFLKSIFIKAVERKSQLHKTKTTMTVLAYGKKIFIEERLFKVKKRDNSYFQKDDRMDYYIGVEEMEIEYPLSKKEYNEYCELFNKNYET